MSRRDLESRDVDTLQRVPSSCRDASGAAGLSMLVKASSAAEQRAGKSATRTTDILSPDTSEEAMDAWMELKVDSDEEV